MTWSQAAVKYEEEKQTEIIKPDFISINRKSYNEKRNKHKSE